MAELATPLVGGTWEQTESLIGKPLAPVLGADTVTVADLRRHQEMLAWACPIHTDPGAARAVGYRDVVSPRSLTRTWGLPPYWSPGSGADDIATLVPATLASLPGEGTAMVGTGNVFEYFEDIYPGDRIRTISVLRSVSRKRTRVGTGAFLVLESIYHNDAGTAVARERATGFRYSPSDDIASPPASVAPTDSDPDRERLEPEPGDFPAIVVALTLQRLIMAAGVTRDFTPIHIDSMAAQAVGASDAFANATLVEALTERAVREWVGNEARIVRLSTKLSGFACAGQTLRITGRVANVISETARDIAVRVDGPCGKTSSADVRVVSRPSDAVSRVNEERQR